MSIAWGGAAGLRGWLADECREVDPIEWPAARRTDDSPSPFERLVDQILDSDAAAAAAWEVLWRLRPGLPRRAGEVAGEPVEGNPFLPTELPDSLPDPDALLLLRTANRLSEVRSFRDIDVAGDLERAWLGPRDQARAALRSDDVLDDADLDEDGDTTELDAAEESATRALLHGEPDLTTRILIAHASAATTLIREGRVVGDILVRQSVLPVATVALEHLVDEDTRTWVRLQVRPAHRALGKEVDPATRRTLQSWSNGAAFRAIPRTIIFRATRRLATALRGPAKETGPGEPMGMGSGE